MNLFPVFMGKSVLDGLDLAIKSLYQVKGNNSKGGKDFKDVIKAKAAEHGKIVKEAVMVLFSKEEYLQYLKETAKSDAALGNGVIDITGEATGGRSVRTVPPKKPVQHHKATRSDPKRVHSIAKETSSDLDRVMNLTSKGICICDQVVIPLDDTFICVHCNYCYHYSCMKQKSKAKHCSYCYLSKMLPNKEVKKTLFIGLLKKGIKKHQFSIKL